MTPDRAQQILEALAGGVDPRTGRPLAKSAVLENPQVIRALYQGAKALALLPALPPSAGSPAPAKRPGVQMAGQPWTADEEQRLLAGFDSGMSIDGLAAEHGRSPGAISSRLVRLGRIDEQSPPSSPSPSQRLESVQ